MTIAFFRTLEKALAQPSVLSAWDALPPALELMPATPVFSAVAAPALTPEQLLALFGPILKLLQHEHSDVVYEGIACLCSLTEYPANVCSMLQFPAILTGIVGVLLTPALQLPHTGVFAALTLSRVAAWPAGAALLLKLAFCGGDALFALVEACAKTATIEQQCQRTFSLTTLVHMLEAAVGDDVHVLRLMLSKWTTLDAALMYTAAQWRDARVVATVVHDFAATVPEGVLCATLLPPPAFLMATHFLYDGEDIEMLYRHITTVLTLQHAVWQLKEEDGRVEVDIGAAHLIALCKFWFVRAYRCELKCGLLAILRVLL